MHRRAMQAVLAAQLSLAATAHAQAQDACPAALYKALGPQLDVQHFAPAEQGGTVVAATCKPAPQGDGTLLAALAYGGEDEEVKTLFVGVLDRKTLRIVRSYSTTITEDAAVKIGDRSLHLDTARYQLDAQTRAIGLRFDNDAHGPSCGDFNSSKELTLFVPDGEELRPVLTLAMHQVRALQGCLGSGGDDKTVVEFADLTLALDKAATHGQADLVVQAAITKDGINGPDARPRKERWTLRYDGKRYQLGNKVPWWIGAGYMSLL